MSVVQGRLPYSSILYKTARTKTKKNSAAVYFSDDVLNREVQVRESRQVHGEGLFGRLETSWRTRRGMMIELIEGNEFLDGSPILLVDHFIVETTRVGLVYFC